MADGLEGLDEAALNAKLKAAESYEDRAAIRKALRDLKKSKGIEVGGGRSRGTSQYNRFAGRTSADAKASVKQSFVPSTSSKTPNPPTSTGSSSPSQSVSSPTPPPPTSATPPAEREREREEREKREREEKEREEREKREREEKEREERKEREREEREREKERREREREEKEKEKLREEEERREKRRQEREREREERERKEREEREKKEQEERERERERKEKEQREREEREKKEQEEKEREEREKKEEEEREREKANEGGDDIVVAEEEDEVKSEQTNKEKEDLWVMVDKEAAKELEKKASIDSTDGRGPDRVQLRKTEPPPTKPRSGTTTNTTTDFGVKLKPRTQSDVTSVPPTDKKSKSLATPTNRTGGGGAPKTLADFQKLTSRGKQSPAGEPTQSNAPKDKRALIRMYVNAALEVRPPVSSDHEFYQLCTRPSNLCKLINKSVRHTVDLRALTKTPPPSASTAEKTEAIEENMLLVVESARAIGCSVTDNMVEELTRGDKGTIDKLIIELIKSRVVHMPGMEDEPSSTFNDLSSLMSKLGLAYTDSTEANGGTGTTDSSDGGGGGVSRSWRDEPVNVSRTKDGGVKERTDEEYTPHSATGSWREEKKTPEIDLSKPSLDANLSYEERAAIRRAERERRKKEREALAVPK